MAGRHTAIGRRAVVLVGWVGEAGGRPLAGLRHRRSVRSPGTPEPGEAVNAALATTAQLYVMRAACGARSYRREAVSSSTTGPAMAADLERDCEAALPKMLHIRANRPHEEIRSRLAAYRPGKTEIVEAGFLTIEAVHEQTADVATVIRTVRSRYSRLHRLRPGGHLARRRICRGHGDRGPDATPRPRLGSNRTCEHGREAWCRASPC
jgi:hypothetical protein